jgi:polyhydroxyalkanoate synthesis regulator phasin
MKTDGIKTTHDLAEYLEEVAKGLRFLPEMALEDANRKRPAKKVMDDGPVARQSNHTVKHEELKVLADQIRELTKDEAEARLLSLTVPAIRQLALLVDIRVPSKATKGEHIETLLLHLFDIPAGHEVIRTFRDRQRATPVRSA